MPQTEPGYVGWPRLDQVTPFYVLAHTRERCRHVPVSSMKVPGMRYEGMSHNVVGVWSVRFVAESRKREARIPREVYRTILTSPIIPAYPRTTDDTHGMPQSLMIPGKHARWGRFATQAGNTTTTTSNHHQWQRRRHQHQQQQHQQASERASEHPPSPLPHGDG